ncbi:MAG TPA: ParB/RepB/Spo0J family partition protein [Pirellulales bacterium]|nr:ParB/RepB/Spo0J family partition protein [Pirellulales bacterium]
MTETIQQIALGLIDRRPQVREEFDEQLIAGLAANIESAGLEYPVILYKDGERYGIEDGERRCRAFELLGRKAIPAIVKEKPSEAQLLLRQCAVDFQRVDLSPLEKAAGIERLMRAAGWKASEAAAKLGVSAAKVSRLLSLLSLPQPIREAVKAGRIPASAGYELAKVDDAAMQAEIAERLAQGKLSRDAVAGERKAARRRGNATAKAAKRRTAMLGGGRAVTVCTTGGTLDDFIAVLEDALSKARRGRTQGFSLTTFLRLLRDQAEPA